MNQRWQVRVGFVKYKGVVYYAGDYMPETFTDKDRERQVYSRRLIKVAIPDKPSTISTPVTPGKVVTTAKSAISANKPSTTTTGTKTSIKK